MDITPTSILPLKEEEGIKGGRYRHEKLYGGKVLGAEMGHDVFGEEFHGLLYNFLAGVAE